MDGDAEEAFKSFPMEHSTSGGGSCDPGKTILPLEAPLAICN